MGRGGRADAGVKRRGRASAAFEAPGPARGRGSGAGRRGVCGSREPSLAPRVAWRDAAWRCFSPAGGGPVSCRPLLQGSAQEARVWGGAGRSRAEQNGAERRRAATAGGLSEAPGPAATACLRAPPGAARCRLGAAAAQGRHAWPGCARLIAIVGPASLRRGESLQPGARAPAGPPGARRRPSPFQAGHAGGRRGARWEGRRSCAGKTGRLTVLRPRRVSAGEAGQRRAQAARTAGPGAPASKGSAVGHGGRGRGGAGFGAAARRAGARRGY